MSNAPPPLPSLLCSEKESSGMKRWGKLNLADAIKTARVPRLIGRGRSPSDESQGGQGQTDSEEKEQASDTASSVSRTSSNKDKYKSRSPITTLGVGRLNQAGCRVLDSGVASIEENSSTRSLTAAAGATPADAGRKLQRTSRIEEDTEAAGNGGAGGEPRAPGAVPEDVRIPLEQPHTDITLSGPLLSLQPIPATGPAAGAAVPNNSGAKAHWERGHDPRVEQQQGQQQGQGQGQQGGHTSSGGVPGLQPTLHNRCQMSSGWL